MGASFVHNTSELLALLCFGGLVAVGLRWRSAVRRDFLLAFAIFLIGGLIREVVVWGYGVATSPEGALHWSALGRLVQIAGAATFLRASLREICGEWGWISVLLTAALAAMVM